MKNIRIKTVLISIVLIHLFLPDTSAQGESDESLYAAYLTSSKTFWKNGVGKMKSIYEKNETTENLFNLALAEYGLLNITMKDQDEDLFDEYIDEAIEHLEKLIDTDSEWGDPKALLSSVYGFKMAYSPWKGIYLGSKSSSLIEKAKKDSNSPLVWKLYANSKLFTPETWGGDKVEALRAYEKSIKLYEAQDRNLSMNWLYLDTLAWLGQAYMANDQNEKAISTYEKALKVEPDFYWVSKSLLPRAKKSKP